MIVVGAFVHRTAQTVLDVYVYMHVPDVAMFFLSISQLLLPDV